MQCGVNINDKSCYGHCMGVSKKRQFKLLAEGGLANLNWKSGLREVCRFDPLSADFHIQRNKWPNIEQTKLTHFWFSIEESS
jgi:hypothetical protein